MRYLLLIAIILGSVHASFAQQTDEQLAAHYFQTGDYEKAALYYEKLYDSKNTAYFFDQYFKTLVGLERYSEAEKLVKNHMNAKAETRAFTLNLATCT